VSKLNLLAVLHRAFAQHLIEAMLPEFAAAPLKPLSPRERGWGEGPSAHGGPTP
jgi:exodeoxyribonuclease V beta subunit